MEIINNFSDIFLSVWNKGILGVDIFQILIGIGIFLIFLIFRGLISKLIIKKLDIISKRLSNKSFVDRAPKNIVDQEKNNYNELQKNIDKISITVKGL